MHVYNVKIISAAVMNTTINSSAYNVQQLFGAAIQAVFTSTPTGTFKLQGSADPATSPNPGNGTGANPVTNWSDLDSTSYSVTAAGNFMWNITDIMYNWIRLVYTDTSSGASTAILNATINAKGP